MNSPGTQQTPGQAPLDPLDPLHPRAGVGGDLIGAEIGDVGDGSQIAVGKDIQQTAIGHVEN